MKKMKYSGYALCCVGGMLVGPLGFCRGVMAIIALIVGAALVRYAAEDSNG